MITDPSQSTIEVSIIIVNHNTLSLTYECIRSIYENLPSISFEIILIDNGSNEDVQESSFEEFPAVRLIKTGENLGYAKANNLGIHNSHGKFILLLNSDTRFLDSSMDAMIRYLHEHPSVGALGPRNLDGNLHFQLSCGKFPTFFSEIVRKIWTYRLSINDYWVRDYLDSKHAELSQVDWISGSCLLLRRDVLLKTGLLDERFFMYFEDIDLCRRVSTQNHSVHYFYDTCIIHFGGGSAKLNLMRVLTEYRSSQIYFTRKYYGRVGEIIIRLLLSFKYLIHFLTSLPPFIFNKILQQDSHASFARLLLAKKILFIALRPIEANAQIPTLQTPSSRVEKTVLSSQVTVG